jgi:hypothetical protein
LKFTDVVFEVRTKENTFHPTPFPASIQPRYRDAVRYLQLSIDQMIRRVGGRLRSVRFAMI